ENGVSLSEYMCTQSVRSVKSHGSPRTVVAKSAPGWLVTEDAPPIVNDCAALWAASPSTNRTLAAQRLNRRIVLCLTITTCIPGHDQPRFPWLPQGSAEQPVSHRRALCRTLLARESGRPAHWMNLVRGDQRLVTARACTFDRQAAYQCNDNYFRARDPPVRTRRVTRGKPVHEACVRPTGHGP